MKYNQYERLLDDHAKYRSKPLELDKRHLRTDQTLLFAKIRLKGGAIGDFGYIHLFCHDSIVCIVVYTYDMKLLAAQAWDDKPRGRSFLENLMTVYWKQSSYGFLSKMADQGIINYDIEEDSGKIPTNVYPQNFSEFYRKDEDVQVVNENAENPLQTEPEDV